MMSKPTPKTDIDSPDGITIILDYPITIDGTEITSIFMRRPKMRDEISYTEAKGSQGKKLLSLLASLTQIAPEDLMGLDATDSDRLFLAYQKMKGIDPDKDENDEEGGE